MTAIGIKRNPTKCWIPFFLTGLRKIFYSPFGILIFIEATVKQDLICKRKSGFRLQQNTRNVCF
ncbi:hypothetical protein BM735_00105 [Erysipelotrichaceae bacterium NYU-BL-F16]|nr:hypothetical protein BM735_00105 [Erysipelotrichaceae bacterium NYU-BL-F16]